MSKALENYIPALKHAAAGDTWSYPGDVTFTGTVNITTFQVGGVTVAATPAEINRVADVSTRIVTLTGDTTISVASHENKTLLLGEVGGNALLTVTLPAATGSGAIYRFIVSVVNTSNYVINASTNGADITGSIIALQDAADTVVGWEAAATSNTITLNGTTTGGAAIGDYLEIQDILTDEYAVRGVVTATGTEATPFSAV